MTNNDEADRIQTVLVGEEPDVRRIAVISTGPAPASGLSIVWLGGFRSDMGGTKAVAVESHARALGIHCVRFDYSGHGQSSGHYTDGTISRWVEESLAVIRALAGPRLLLVGSSMGGWIALRIIEELRKAGSAQKIEGLILIAPAPDFTSALIEPHLTENELKSLAERGYFEEKSDYGMEPNRFSQNLLDDGRANSVMGGLIATGCPVHILQGMRDTDVPYQHVLKIMEKIVADDAILTLIRDGDHRLSRPEDIDKLRLAVTEMAAGRHGSATS